jgi:hypothetical protein
VIATVLGAAVAAPLPALAAPPDPCALISTADASSALGYTPPKARTRTAGRFRSCTCTVRRKSLTVQTRSVATQAAFDRGARAHEGLVVPIQGVGADAWSANGTTLLLWKNGIEVLMTFVGVTPFVATQQQLVRTASGRL